MNLELTQELIQAKKVIVFDLDGTIVSLQVNWNQLKKLLEDKYFKIYKEHVEVKIGEVTVSSGTAVLSASGVGSCLVITIYDPHHKIVGMAHAMLSYKDTGSPASDIKYIEPAIDKMLAEIVTLGGERAKLEAKLIGGANMFRALVSDISQNNIRAAEKKLKKEGIALVGESVGGTLGRSVEFSCATGLVSVKIIF